MGKRESYEPGTFSYVELITTDQNAAKDFYGGLFGWTYDEVPLPHGGSYNLVQHRDATIAGLHQMGDDMEAQGIPPNWLSYVTVASADDAAETAKGLGATVMAGPFDVMEVGRMAVIQDPVGAVFAVWQAGASIGAYHVNDPGTLTWNELATPDPDKALPFYTELFGWGSEPMPTGDGPRYVILKLGDRANGGIRQQDHEEIAAGAPSYWMAYFTVASADAATAKAQELGGSTIFPPMDVTTETPSRIAALRDPQGAAFAIFEGEVDD